MSYGIKIKYVGPLDTKSFMDYQFVRCVTDDASGPTNTPGEMALTVPDNIANAALKHRDVFLQWNQPVPEKVKMLRLDRCDAMEKEGKQGVDHWMLRKAVAMMLPDDTKRKAAIKDGELAGAQAQIDRFQGMVLESNLLRAKVRREMGLTPTDAGAANDAALTAANEQFGVLQEALANQATENQQLRAQLLAMQEEMERNARLKPTEEVAAPSTAEYGVDVDLEETEETPDIFPSATPAAGGPVAVAEPAIRRGGRPPKAK